MTEQLYHSLESYLQTAAESHSRWNSWLAELEQLVVQSDVHSMEKHTQQGAQLEQSLAVLARGRQQLLSDAQAAGLACANLKQLAQALPQWRTNAEFRMRVRSVQQNMHTLRRLHTAAWVLTAQSARAVDETMLLLTHGTTLSGAYIDVPQADLSGGQLLDTEV